MNPIAAAGLFLLVAVSMNEPVKRIPVFKGADLNGRVIDNSHCLDMFNLFLFFDPSSLDHKGKLNYAQVLSNRFSYLRLNVIGVSKRETGQTKRIRDISYIRFPVLSDPKSVIRGAFGIKDCCGGTILTDRKGEIVFSAHSLIPFEHLRQLVEKYVVGNISYDFAGVRWTPPYRRGDVFPN